MPLELFPLPNPGVIDKNILTAWINFKRIQSLLTGGGSVTLTGLNLTGLTASRLIASDASKNLVSVANLATWVLAGSGVTVNNNGDGTVTLSSSGTSFANPTASLGLSVINGSASTAMRSDAAPALSQSIVPTWTGNHTFSSGIYPSYISNGPVTFVTQNKNTALVPFNSGDWTSSNVTFTSSAITANASGTTHSAYRTTPGNINSYGKGLCLKFSFVGNSSTVIAGFTQTPSSFINNTGIRINNASHKVELMVEGGSILAGSALTSGTRYVIELRIFTLSSSSYFVQYWLYDSTGTSLIESFSTTSATTITTGVWSYGVYSNVDASLFIITDIYTIGIDSDSGGGKLNGNLLFCYNDVSGCVGIGTLKPSYTLDLNGSIRVTGKIKTTLTASCALFTDANSFVVEVGTTGSGSSVLSGSPTFTGTISGAALTLSSTLSVTNTVTLSNLAGTGNRAVQASSTGVLSASKTIPSGGFLSTIFNSTTQTGNSGASETDLFSFTVAAATLANNGESIEGKASGTFATSINNKQIKVKWGATTIFDSGSLAIATLSSWVLEFQITRTGAATQKCNVSLTTSSGTLSAYASYSTAAETLSSSSDLKITGTGTSNNDIVGEMAKGIFVPAP